MNTKPKVITKYQDGWVENLTDAGIQKLGAKKANAILTSIQLSLVFVVMLVFGIGSILTQSNKEQEALASGASETPSLEQLQTAVKKEELVEQISSRQAQLVLANKGIVSGYGLLSPKEATIAELEMAKNKLEKEGLDRCKTEIEAGQIDFNCPARVNNEVRNIK